MSVWDYLESYLELLTPLGALLGPLLSIGTMAWVLLTKKNATSAVSWCLLIFFLPIFGPLFFLLFGWQHVNRPLRRKRKQKKIFERMHGSPNQPRADDCLASGELQRDLEAGHEPAAISVPEPASALSPYWQDLERLARRCGSFPATAGNSLTIYNEGQHAYDAMLEAIRSARHHVHLETFVFQRDEIGQLFLDALKRKAREGVQVRLIYDAMGTRRPARAMLRTLAGFGGRSSPFLPLNPLRRRIQVNMRNHRKILIVDGRVGFTGGLNIGDEYRGRIARFGFWRDTHMRLEGPAVAELQWVFLEDWDFAAGENLTWAGYFPSHRTDGLVNVQVIASGPDREMKGIREMYFAAILRARKRIWIATPYFVPDEGLLDALLLAGYQGVDVRLMGLYYPDKWIPYFAGRYYWREVLAAGIKVYQYTKGMLHSKVFLVDGEWASVGTANLDNRSLHLNFEVNCLMYSPAVTGELEQAFRHDLKSAIRLDRKVFASRPVAGRIIDNACRLLSPVL
jgi:cardiolipin synthase